jgi:starch phosphorylase
MDLRERLDVLARNLYWTWHPEAVHVFRDLNPALWREANHNPITFLDRLSDERLNVRRTVMALESRIIRSFHVLRDYLEEQDTWGSRYAGPLRHRPVAYFSAEFGIHESMSIYSGGLGVLAGDHLKAASDLGVPIIGVGLLYAEGYFRQTLDENGWQREDYATADVTELPIERVRDANGDPLRVVLETGTGLKIHAQAWTILVGRCRLILLDTNLAENDEEIRTLTAQLYGGDQRVRIRQELVLGVGGMRILGAMGIHPGVVHLNEGHSAFALLELARQVMERDAQSFANIREIVAAMSVFTTHTPVAAGHDRFEPPLLLETLGPLREALGLSEKECLGLGRLIPWDENEPFCMTVLGLRMSRARNAVSHLHRRVTRGMWRKLWEDEREEDIPIDYITNGIHVASWVAPDMERLYRRYVGPGWQRRMSDPEVWAAVMEIDEEELWEINETLLAQLIAFVRRRVARQCEKCGQPDPTGSAQHPYLNVSALTVGWARRFAEYKRPDLLLRDLDRLDKLVNNPDRPVQIIYAGKAHPANEEGKRQIQRIHQITHDERFVGKIVFIQDYDINVARHMVQGVDLWMNTPRRPLEACGTSGMKAVLNGGLNMSILDGWWAEAYDGANGFAVGNGAEHSDCSVQDARDLGAVCEVLENEVVPLYYDRESDGIPRRWLRRQKHALRTLAWRFSAQRMVGEYVRHFYLPAVGGITSSFQGDPRMRKR